MSYKENLYKPYYEENSLLIEVLVLSTYKKYKFRPLYNDIPFKIKLSPLEVIEDDVLEIHNSINLWQNLKFKRVFLYGENIFSLKCERLIAISNIIHKYFPQCETIGCLSTIRDIKIKTDNELEILHKAGYDSITIEIGTGDNKTLELMKKDYDAEQAIKHCQRLEKFKINYNFIYSVGISGAKRSNEGAFLTADMCNVLHPQVILTSMFKLSPVSHIYKELKNSEWKKSSDLEKIRELKVLIRNLKIPVFIQILDDRNKIKMEGKLPSKRIQMLDKFNKFIENNDEIIF